MSIEEFEDYLDNIGEDLRNSDAILLDIVSPILSMMKQRAPVATGKLKSSISAFVNDGSVKFNMLYYGAYQNYGVGGSESSPTNLKEVPKFGIDQQPSSGSFYRFRNRRFGLPAQQFFDIEQMTDYIVTEYENTITEE